MLFDSSKNATLLSMALLLAILSFFVTAGEVTRPGLYQHVRRAASHMEEKDFDKAIYYLHKAYDRAPQSEAIAGELVFGYLEHARYLHSKGDIEGAIREAELGLEIVPHSIPAVNDVAYYISVKAVERAREGFLEEARKYLQKVDVLTESHPRVRTNIGNHLYNSAVSARDEGDTDTLLLCLKTSYLLNPRFETLSFLGMFFYDIRDLAKAVYYWDKAVTLRPGASEVRENLRKARKEFQLSESKDVIKTTDFDVILYGGHIINRKELDEHLIAVYSDVGRELGYYPPPGTGIILYNEGDFRRIFQTRGIVRGFYDGNIRIAVTGDPSEVFSTGVLAHEYTHAVVSALTENKCPVWLHEGLAVYQQSRYMDIGFDNLKRFVRTGDFVSIGLLENGFMNHDDRDMVRFSYEGSYSAVVFMLEEWGWHGINRLLDGIRKEGHFANALDEKFQITVPHFEQMWNDFLRRRLLTEEERVAGGLR